MILFKIYQNLDEQQLLVVQLKGYRWVCKPGKVHVQILSIPGVPLLQSV